MRRFISGNLNYSSWSIRPLLVLRRSGLDVGEEVIPLDRPGSSERLLQLSPTAKVPVLVWDGLEIWDSLAITEFLSEQAGPGLVWPLDPHRRAIARSVCCEMHAGFQALRSLCPMDIRARHAPPAMTPELKADIARIDRIWTDLRRGHGLNGEEAGPFLFGAWSAADAFFTPVATRLRTYGLELRDEAGTYAAALLDDPVFRQVEAEAQAEPWWIRYGPDGRTSGELTLPAAP